MRTTRTLQADTTDHLAEPLGPAAVARERVCRDGEDLLWAAYGRTHYYDIPGRYPDGSPKPNAVVRGAVRAGDFLGDVVSAALGGADDDASRPPPADAIVFGPAPDCLAHRYLRDVPSVSPVLRRLWTLTPRRLALHAELPPVALREPAAAARGGSFLAKAARVGSGLVKLGRDLAEIVVDNRMTFGGNVEDEPVVAAEFEPLLEVPRERIAAIGVATRSSAPVLRVELVDGSGVDLLVAMTDPEETEYALALTGGAPPVWEDAVVAWAAREATRSLKRSDHLVRPGERVLVAATTNLGHVGVQIGQHLRLPHEPISPVPALDAQKLRWPRPAATTGWDNWVDDPTVAYWAWADHPDRDAVLLADLIAHTRGVARLVLTARRTALIAATKLLAEPPDPPAPLTAVLEWPPNRIRRVGAELRGRSVPPKPLLRVDFVDGSTLWLRDPIAARQATAG